MNATAKFGPLTFSDFYALGYTRLVPIVPHTAQISPKSSLANRPKALGKAVGVKGPDGLWHGIDWIPYECDARDCSRWAAMGAGVGIKTGRQLVGIDADAYDKADAATILEHVMRHFGVLPARVGRFPKTLYVCALTEPMPYTRIDFGPRNEKGQIRDRVEILSDGRQFVAAGIHPETKAPYTWTIALVPRDQLPVFSPAQIIAFLEDLRQVLPAAQPRVMEGAASNVSQTSLKGDIAMVRKAVAATPNNSKAFGTREQWLGYGYAIKAALPDNQAEAFEIYSEWSERWVDEKGEPVSPGNTPEYIAAEWSRCKPPFKRGASYLYELAEANNPTGFRKIDAYFDVIDEPAPSLFAEAVTPSAPKSIQPLEWIDPTKWEGHPLRPREWVVEGWIPKGEVTFLYGDGGVGKSLLAQQFATCAATGRDWLGQPTTPARVMCFFCEDSADELHRRQKDINAAVGVGFPDLRALRLISRKHMDNIFSLWDRNTGALREQAVWQLLLADAKAFNADVLVVDTIADTYSGSEIDRVQVNAFVKSCLGRLAQEIGGSVIALGHPSQAGKSSGSGTSGSTAWSNAARSRLYLRNPKDAPGGNIRELEGMKLNYGPKGSLLKLRWARGAFEVLAGSRPAGAPPSDEAAFQSIGNAAEDAIVSILLSNPGERLNLTQRSPYFAPKILKRLDPDSLAAFTNAEVEAALNSLERRKAIRAERVGQDASYRPIYGYVVVPDNLAADVIAAPITATIFD
jgi:hypothetical protein